MCEGCIDLSGWIKVLHPVPKVPKASVRVCTPQKCFHQIKIPSQNRASRCHIAITIADDVIDCTQSIKSQAHPEQNRTERPAKTKSWHLVVGYTSISHTRSLQTFLFSLKCGPSFSFQALLLFLLFSRKSPPKTTKKELFCSARGLNQVILFCHFFSSSSVFTSVFALKHYTQRETHTYCMCSGRHLI